MSTVWTSKISLIRCPLPGLLEQAGVLERHDEGARERRQQADVPLGESVLAVEVLE